MDQARRIRRWSSGASWVCLMLAVSVLLGWTFDIDFLRRPIAHLVAMNPLTAFCMLFFSLALIALHYSSPRLALVLTSIPVVIALVRLIVPGSFAFQIDLIFFHDKLIREPFGGSPSRMPPVSAVCALVTGAALLLIQSPRLVRHAQQAAMGSGFIALLSVLGYIYNVPEYYGEVPYLPMAIHTALGYWLLAFATFTVEPRSGLAAEIFSDLRGGRSARLLLPAVILIPVILGFVPLWGHAVNKFSVEFGVALFTLLVTVLVSSVVLVYVKMQNRNHRDQMRHDEETLKMNVALSEKNEEVKALLEELTASNEELSSANEELSTLNDHLQEASAKIKEQTNVILQQKDEQLNRTVEATDLVIWSVDLTGNGRHFLSRTFETIMGINTDEFVKTPVESWTKILLKEDLPVRDKARAELLAHGTARVVLRVIDKNGRLRYFDVQQTLVRDSNGAAMRQEGVAMDITFVKQSEQSLIAERKLLRSLIDNIPDYIFVKDEQLRHIINNKANVELLGANNEAETLGKTVTDYIGEAGKELIQDDRQILSTGEPIINRQEYVPDPEGKIRTLLTTKVPLRDEDGAITRIVGISRDITDVLKKDEELSRYRQNLDIIFSNTMEEIYLLDNVGRIVLFNHAADKFMKAATGIALEVGQYIWDVTLPDRKDVARMLFERAIKGEDVVNEARLVLPTGITYREVHYEPVRKDGEIKYVSLISLDITSKKERDTHRQKAEEEKNILVEQLIHQNNDLLQFSFIASHNLRGPVASVLGLLNLMRGQQMSEETALMISMLRQSVQRLDAVIKDLSKILEMRSSQMHAKETVQVAQLLGTIQVELQMQIIESQGQIVMEEMPVTSLYTIRSYLHSILYNLISNAIKYRHKSRPALIRVRTFQTNDDIGIVVSDNGSGIDLHKFGDKVFGMYQRFHLDVEGKGIGLYMVKTQVQLLRGDIRIASQPGVGTTFTITIPAKA